MLSICSSQLVCTNCKTVTKSTLSRGTRGCSGLNFAISRSQKLCSIKFRNESHSKLLVAHQSVRAVRSPSVTSKRAPHLDLQPTQTSRLVHTSLTPSKTDLEKPSEKRAASLLRRRRRQLFRAPYSSSVVVKKRSNPT